MRPTLLLTFGTAFSLVSAGAIRKARTEPSGELNYQGPKFESLLYKECVDEYCAAKQERKTPAEPGACWCEKDRKRGEVSEWCQRSLSDLKLDTTNLQGGEDKDEVKKIDDYCSTPNSLKHLAFPKDTVDEMIADPELFDMA